MEALKRRAEALSREIDVRRQMAGEPSVLDLRPVGGPEVEALLSDWRQLLSIDGMNNHATIPYERLSHYIDRTGRSEIVRRIMVHLTDARNRWVEEQREAK